MGCDGGTIPKRDELVRTKKKPEQVRTKVLLYFLNTSLKKKPKNTQHLSYYILHLSLNRCYNILRYLHIKK